MNLDNIAVYRIGWYAVAIMLGAGSLLPFFTFTKFYFFDDTFSLLSGVFHLLEADEPLLFVVVFLFSIVLPAYKLLILFRLISDRNIETKQRQRYVSLLALIGKWSMLDVFVVAMMIMMIRLGTIVSVQVHSGLYLFVSGVLGSVLLTQRVAQHAAGPSLNR